MRPLQAALNARSPNQFLSAKLSDGRSPSLGAVGVQHISSNTPLGAFNRMRAFVSDCAGCLPAQIIAYTPEPCRTHESLTFAAIVAPVIAGAR